MISRKRCKSPTLAASEISSKRTKILSNLWQSDDTFLVGTARNKTASRPICTTTRVIGETPSKDRRTREDSSTIRPNYTSSLRTKQNRADAAADSDGLDHSNSSGKLENSIPLTGETGDNTFKLKVGRKSRRKRPDRVIHSHAHSTESEIDNHQTEFLGDSEHRLSNATHTSFTVQICQHSSFEPDQYIQYPSSLSTQSVDSSLSLHQDSGLDESSPYSILDTEKVDQNVIVPDSQSLANSSSYVPSTSASEVTSSNESSQHIGFFHSSRVADNSEIDSFSQCEYEATQTGDALSSSVVSASESLVISSQRSRSAPPQTSSVVSANLSSGRVVIARLSRSESASSPVIPESLSQISSSRLVRTSTQGGDSFSGTKSSVTETQRAYFNEKVEVSTQVLTDFVVPSDQLEENWQSGQIVQTNVKSASQSSSESIAQIPNPSVSSRKGTFSLRPERNARKQLSAFPLAFVISEDPVDNSEATQTAEPSSSSQRDPNSRTNRHSLSAQANKDVTLSSINSLDSKIEKFSNSQVSPASSQVLATMSERDSPAASSATIPDRLPPPSGFFPSRSSQQGTISTGYPSARSPMPHRVPPQAGYFLGKTPSILMAGTPPNSVSSEPGTSDRDTARASRMSSSRPIPMAGVSGVSAGPPVSLREKLREMRATSKANITPRRLSQDQKDSARVIKTPSLVVEKLEVQPQEEQSRLEVRPLKVPVEMPLPVRAVPPTPPPPTPHAPTYPSKLSYHTEASYSQKTTKLTPVHLKEMEFVIPLSMNPRVRDQYISTINYYQRDIEKFMKERTPSHELVEKIRAMLERVKQVTTHIDLDGGGGISQGQEAAEDEAVWAETCSAKFLFLRHFLSALRYFDVHIAIVARSGQLHDIIETFLIGTHMKYSRPETVSKSEPSVSKGRLEVTLIASGEDGASSLPKTANLVIAFDGSFNAKDVQVGLLRGHLLNVNQLSPVIHLLVYKSAEHIERCLPESMNLVERLRRIVSCMTQTRNDVGQLLPDEANTSAVAEEAAAFLELGGLERDWTFPSIRAIENIETFEVMDVAPTNQSEKTSTMDQNMASPSLAVKRALERSEMEDLSAPLKRQRSTPIGDNTHVSDSINQEIPATDSISVMSRRRLENEVLSLRLARDRREDEYTRLQAERDTLSSNLRTVKSEEGYLKIVRDALENDKKRLREDLEKAQQFGKEMEHSLHVLQTRYEEQNRRCHTLRIENEDSTAAAESLKRKQGVQATEISKLTAARANLEQELKAARGALLSSDVPSVAEVESLNSELRTLRAANANIEKKAASQSHDYEYMKSRYQTATTDAATHLDQIASLERELEVAQRQAQGEATRLASISRTEETRQALKNVERLSLELASRERLLQKQAEDLKEFKDFKRGRGGVVTRGSSVQAKSPRGGSRAGSPGVGASGYGGKVGGSGLRYGGGIGSDGR